MSDNMSIEFYLTVGRRDRWDLYTPKVTKNKPTIGRGEIAVKVKLVVPASAFEEFIPEGELRIPADANLGRPALQVHVPHDIELQEGMRLELVAYDPDEEDGIPVTMRDHPLVVTPPEEEA